MLSETMQNQFQGFSYNRPIAGLGDAGGSVKDPSFVGSLTRVGVAGGNIDSEQARVWDIPFTQRPAGHKVPFLLEPDS